MTVKITQEESNGIEFVRRSGIVNMLDWRTVRDLLGIFGYDEAHKWVRNHKRLYAKLIIEGSEILEENLNEESEG